MSTEPEKLFDLMDTEVEPTDEQLERLMQYVGESVQRKKALRPPPPSPAEISALADKLQAELLSDEH